MCVCVAKPVAVELRCHATALIFSFVDSFVFKQQVLFSSRRYSPVRGKGNSLLPVAICFYFRKFVPRSGGKRAILGYVWKNGPVQEDINPSIYIIDLTPLVYKNPTFYRSNFFLMIWKESY